MSTPLLWTTTRLPRVLRQRITVDAFDHILRCVFSSLAPAIVRGGMHSPLSLSQTASCDLLHSLHVYLCLSTPCNCHKPQPTSTSSPMPQLLTAWFEGDGLEGCGTCRPRGCRHTRRTTPGLSCIQCRPPTLSLSLTNQFPPHTSRHFYHSMPGSENGNACAPWAGAFPENGCDDRGSWCSDSTRRSTQSQSRGPSTCATDSRHSRRSTSGRVRLSTIASWRSSAGQAAVLPYRNSTSVGVWHSQHSQTPDPDSRPQTPDPRLQAPNSRAWAALFDSKRWILKAESSDPTNAAPGAISPTKES